jgi:hypothetical protein
VQRFAMMVIHVWLLLVTERSPGESVVDLDQGLDSATNGNDMQFNPLLAIKERREEAHYDHSARPAKAQQLVRGADRLGK